MFEVTVETHFSSAHNLRGYKGKCEALHGHNWRVQIAVCSENLDNLGLVIDFTVLKEQAKQVMEILDHKYLNEIPPFDKINPSSENLAKFILEEMNRLLGETGHMVNLVRVWESASSFATYRTGLR